MLCFFLFVSCSFLSSLSLFCVHDFGILGQKACLQFIFTGFMFSVCTLVFT